MFGLFGPKCPIDLTQKVWTEFRMRWLIDRLGPQRLLSAQVVLPTDEFFPTTYQDDPKVIRALFDHLAGLMGVTTPIELNIVPETELPDAGGVYLAGSPATVLIKDSILADPFETSAVLMHELAHEVLLGGGLLTSDEADHEQVTDLLLVFLGVGIIPANNTVKDRSWHAGGWDFFQIRKAGYLSAAEFGYAFALFAYIRGEENPSWALFLRPDAREVMEKGLRFLFKTGDTTCRPERLRKPLAPTTAAEVGDSLEHGTPSDQLLTLWLLEQNMLQQAAVIEQVEAKLLDRNWVIAASAADALGIAGMAAKAAVPSLLARLSARHAKVRAAAAGALGQIKSEPEKTIPALREALRDIDPDVVAVSGYALGQFGQVAREESRTVLQALDAALYRNRSGPGLHYLINGFLMIEAEPIERIHQFFEDGNDEHRDELLEMIATMASADPTTSAG
jgi:hypothetical protein